MQYLLDTNILSDLMRNPRGRVAENIRRVGELSLCTSIIVASELRFGVEKRSAPRLSTQLDSILRGIAVLPFKPPADVFYGRIRAALERSGRIIGANDLLIAAHALSLDCILVTDNVSEFERIDGLITENWLR